MHLKNLSGASILCSQSLSALNLRLSQFGTQTVPPPPILKALPKIFGHTDKTVRAEGTALTQHLYQCIGAAIEPFLNDLKPVQVKELHEAFGVMDGDGKGKGTFKAERLTRQQARDAEQMAANGEDAPAAVEEEAAPDPRAFAEEVDIVPKLPSGYLAALASSKWKERKEALDEIVTALNTPKIKDASELGELVKALAGRMNDANINCVMGAAACLEALANGLMKAFARHRETVVPPMLGRLKERKQNVVDALGSALDAVFTTVSSLFHHLSYITRQWPAHILDDACGYHCRYSASVVRQKPSDQRGYTQIFTPLSLVYTYAASSCSSEATVRSFGFPLR